MKLFAKYNRINILATILIFLAASIAFYFTLNYVLFNQVDEDLRIEEREIKTYIEHFNRLPENLKVRDQIIAYSAVTTPFGKRQIRTLIQKDPFDNEEEKFRQIQFGAAAGEQQYLVSVSKSLEETDNFFQLMVTISVVTILAILIVTFLINRFVLQRLWQPFNLSLDQVKNFRVSESPNLRFSPTEIDEFRLMNKTLEELTERARFEYLSLKTFSENASHEIQTPIAIIQSKLDLLIQDAALTETQSKTVQAVYDAILRLSRLNASLLLLAKIENKQYAEVENVNLTQILREKIDDFREWWQASNLQPTVHLEPASIVMNSHLAELLLNNLLSNATRYNYSGGSVSVLLRPQLLIVKNTSHEPELDAAKIFQRFYKSSTAKAGHGLGLSVIKQTCDASGIDVKYLFNKSEHCFRFSWETDSSTQ